MLFLLIGQRARNNRPKDIVMGDLDVIFRTVHLWWIIIDLEHTWSLAKLPKSVLTPICAPITGDEPPGAALYGSADSPWHRVGWSTTSTQELLPLCTLLGRSMHGTQTVHDWRRGLLLHRKPICRLSRGTPSKRRDPRCVLGLACH
jgi:hypothetical protein